MDRGKIPGPPRVLCMGNIGRSQGLARIVETFETNERLRKLGAELILTGAGVAQDEVWGAIRTERTKMLGVIELDELKAEMARAHLGAVTQSYSGGEFNVPSKLMNYMAVGLPVVASVKPESETARIVNRSGGGWVSDSASPESFADSILEAFTKREELTRRGQAGVKFAESNLTIDVLADKFEQTFKIATSSEK